MEGRSCFFSQMIVRYGHPLLVILCRFVFTFALGAGPVPGLLLPEIFPNRIRAKAMAVCMSVHWVIFFTPLPLF